MASVLTVLLHPLKSGLRNIHKLSSKLPARCASFYPVDDNLYGLTEEQIQLRKTSFDFLQKELAPYTYEIDKTDKFDGMKDFMKKCGQLGFIGVNAEPQYGGSGLGYFEFTLIGEEMARVSPAVALSWGAHSNLCLNQLTKNATHEQKEKYIPKLCSGELIGCLAMSEPEAGSDVLSMKTTAEKDGEYYILNGSKLWITNARYADLFVVYAKTDPNAPKISQRVSAFIIEKSFEGFSVGKPMDKLGMRGSGTAELVFENCKVPALNILGDVGKGVSVLFSGLDLERLLLAAGPIGIMQACCDVAFEYVHTRKQFNTLIGEFQLMQGKITDMYAALSACRSYLYTVLRACDKGHVNSKDCATVALYCAEMGTQVALQAIQCLGGNGYINDYPTGRLLRDAKLYEIGGGTSEVRRSLIGRIINSEYKHLSKL